MYNFEKHQRKIALKIKNVVKFRFLNISIRPATLLAKLVFAQL